jgi:hypothetical protein
MLNPTVNTAKNWEWIDSLLTGARCMNWLYFSHYDLDKREILSTYKGCLEFAVEAFNTMELPIEGQKMAQQIESEREKSYEFAILAASDLTSPFANWNATRASICQSNADRLMAVFKETYGKRIL